MANPERSRVSRGRCLPSSAAVLLVIYAVVQLKSDIPSRWTAFLRLDAANSIFATPEYQESKQVLIGNGGTEAPIPQQQQQPSGESAIGIKEGNADKDHVTVGASAALKVAASALAVARETFQQKCNDDRQSKKRKDLKKDFEEYLTTIFTPPSNVRKIVAGSDPVEPCQNAFIDLGANIGDSMGKLIDSGFAQECPNLGQKSPHYNLTTGIMELGRGNVLSTFSREVMNDLGRSPEDYCYVGVEGNPVFTERLQQLESRVMDTSPRPLRAAHFYTESVGAGEDGPTFLYLDTVNAANNFWGSSILSTHQDAKKSAAENGNVTVKAPVMGITLSTLLKRSVQKVNGSHVIIKIDIEGGEYVVINEAIDTLCDFTSAGVRVDLMMETHSRMVTGQVNRDMRRYRSVTSKRIPECNIRTGALSGASH